MKSLFPTLLFIFSMSLFAAEEKGFNLEEVLNVIRTNMVDLTEAELSNAAAIGLLKELGTRVQFVGENGTNAATSAEQQPDAISKTAVYQNQFGYIRIKAVDDRLTNEFSRRVTELLASNKLAGIVVDLRYATGTNYDAAAAAADEFVKGGQPLLKLGDRQIHARDRASDIQQPIAVLVNSETRAAAEALAGILRESAAALVIGSKTAGEARLYETFTLSTGQKLRVGKIPVQVGRGKTLGATGIIPDLEVKLTPEEERAYYQDPFRERRLFTIQGTNIVAAFVPGGPRSEAELVQRHRDQLGDPERVEAPARPPSEVPVITDPTLARALDFLKGISILQPRR